MQADAAHAGAALAFEGRKIVRIDAIAHAQHALARSAARGDAAGYGGAVELRQERFVLGQGVDLRGIGLGAKAPAFEEPRDAPGDLPHHPLDLEVLGGRQGMEAQRAVRTPLVDAVEEQRVEVDVQVQRVAEALHEGDRAALAADHAPLPARTSAEGGEDSPHEDTQHGARERSIVGKAVAQPERKREHPLSHGHLGEDAVYQVCGRVGHASAATRRAEAPALAREGDDTVEPAVVAVHAHEAVGEDPAAQEAAKLALDEARHDAFARVGPGQEGLELRLDDAVEHALLRLSAGVVIPSTPTIPVRRAEGSGCKSAHAARPLPGACPSRAAPSAFVSSNRSKNASPRSPSDPDGCSRR